MMTHREQQALQQLQKDLGALRAAKKCLENDIANLKQNKSNLMAEINRLRNQLRTVKSVGVSDEQE